MGDRVPRSPIESRTGCCPSARIIVASSLTEIIDLFIDGTVNEVSIVLCMNTKIYILRCGNAFYKTEVNYRPLKYYFKDILSFLHLNFQQTCILNIIVQPTAAANIPSHPERKIQLKSFNSIS